MKATLELGAGFAVGALGWWAAGHVQTSVVLTVLVGWLVLALVVAVVRTPL